MIKMFLILNVSFDLSFVAFLMQMNNMNIFVIFRRTSTGNRTDISCFYGGGKAHARVPDESDEAKLGDGSS